MLAGGTMRGARGQATPDSLSRDSLPGHAATRDTAVSDSGPRFVAVLPAAVSSGPLPVGARWVFDADSLRLAGLFTLSEVLAQLPGVYLARGGFYGQPEYALYAGRGPAALEVYWDGVPYLPLGRDSLYLDPARIPLSPLESVDVRQHPGRLRVYLVTARHPSTEPGSSVRVVTGDRDVARYVGTFTRRWRSGAGLSLVADWGSIDGLSGSSSSAYTDIDIWLKLDWTRGDRVGVSYQYLSSSWEREGEAGLVDPWSTRRADAALRFFVAPRGRAPGPRFELAVANATATGDSAVTERAMGQVLLRGEQRWRRAQVSGAVRLGDGRRPHELELGAAWAPHGAVTVAADARRAEYRGGRAGTRVTATGGVALPLGLSLRADVAWADDVQAPVLPGDAAQPSFDVGGAVRIDRAWAALELGAGERDAYAPAGVPAGLLPVVDLRATPASRYLTVHGSVRPVPWLALAGWYFDPLDGGGDFEPPHHARVALSFFSRFLRAFPSATFVLRADVRFESWGSWTAGLGPGGVPLDLVGASFMDLHVALQISDVTAFWTMRNVNRMRAGYVPALGYPGGLQLFGVRWDFRN